MDDKQTRLVDIDYVRDQLLLYFDSITGAREGEARSLSYDELMESLTCALDYIKYNLQNK